MCRLRQPTARGRSADTAPDRSRRLPWIRRRRTTNVSRAAVPRRSTSCDASILDDLGNNRVERPGLLGSSWLKCTFSNRYHHRLKTFHAGWHDMQLPDGTVIWTSPTGREYQTKPAGAELFPELMTRRRRTRAQERASRIARER